MLLIVMMIMVVMAMVMVVKMIEKRELIDYMQYEIFAKFCKCILYTVIHPSYSHNTLIIIHLHSNQPQYTLSECSTGETGLSNLYCNCIEVFPI